MAKKDTVFPWQAFGLLLLLAIGLAVDFRFPFLDGRPMHTDEAILGIKFIEFWKTGHFAYDPRDYHGPGLHWITRFIGVLGGWTGPEMLTETKLRLVTAICGTLLVLSTLLIRSALGRLATVTAMLLMAVSPMQVFYSRYFIMEVPFVLMVAVFIAACWRYARSSNPLWLIVAGIALGFQHATKETFILNLAAAGTGWVAARFIAGGFTPKQDNRLRLSSGKQNGRRVWLWVLVPAVLVSITLYSSLFKDWQAVRDSVTTYGHYFERAGGSGHEKPWHYYLTLLTYRNMGVVWSEGLIMGLALVGIAYAFIGEHRDSSRQSFLIFLSVYAMALLGAYSLLAYKTPWSILAAQHAFILLAGVGAAVLWSAFRRSVFGRVVAASLFGAGIWHLSQQTHQAIHDLRASEERNPYVYSHTSSLLLSMLDSVRKLEKTAAEKMPDKPFSVEVINQDQGWPLPWYLRDRKNVGFQSKVPETLDAPVIIVDSDLAGQVESRLGERPYNKDTISALRPGTVLIMYVDAKLWQEHIGYLSPQLQKP